jgi:hypothetical protein
MRLVAMTLAFALALQSLGFAPAPMPRTRREAPPPSRERLLAECRRRLDELGVRWRLEDRNGRRMVRFSVQHPNGGGMSGADSVDGDLADTLRDLIKLVEAFFRNPKRF